MICGLFEASELIPQRIVIPGRGRAGQDRESVALLTVGSPRGHGVTETVGTYVDLGSF